MDSIAERLMIYLDERALTMPENNLVVLMDNCDFNCPLGSLERIYERYKLIKQKNMTPEERQETLKNSLIKRVQKDEKWAEPIEDAIKTEIRVVIARWLSAASTEGIGPKEVVKYLDEMNEYIGTMKIINDSRVQIIEADRPD